MSELNGWPSCKTCGRDMDQTDAGTFYCPVSHLNCGQALAELRVEVKALRARLAEAVKLLAEWCAAVDVNGAGWDDWDMQYKYAMYGDTPIRTELDAAIKLAKESWGK